GWKTNAAIVQRWSVRGERLNLRAGEANSEATLWSEKDYGDAEFVIDCRPSKTPDGKTANPMTVVVLGVEVELDRGLAGKYQRYSITVDGKEITVKRGGEFFKRALLSP